METKIWVALDVSSADEARRLAEALHPHRHFKVGMELFYREGPGFVREMIEDGHAIFLDLKLLDIPRTVAKAAAQLRDLEVELLTIHSLGGSEMLRAAQEEAGEMALVGVTVLTSLDKDTTRELGIVEPLGEWTMRLAHAVKRAGLSGVVSSGQEVQAIQAIWPEARLIVPGIRLPDQTSHDQKRVTSPRQAVSGGATDLVVGRSVVMSPDPRETLLRIGKEINQHGMPNGRFA